MLYEFGAEELAWHGFARAGTTVHSIPARGSHTAAGTPAAHTPNTGTTDETAAHAELSMMETNL